jgi:hypothetical protein
MTNTPAAENKPKIARLGRYVLLSWSVESERGPNEHEVHVYRPHYQDAGFDLEPLEQAKLPMTIGPVEDMTTTPSGDVVFAASTGPRRDRLSLQRVRACPK